MSATDPVPEKEYVSAEYLAKKYAVTPQHLGKLSREGKLPHLWIGDALRFDEAEVQAHCEAETARKAKERKEAKSAKKATA